MAMCIHSGEFETCRFGCTLKICPYCNGYLRKINGSDMTYYVCDKCEEIVEPEEKENANYNM